MSSPTSNIAFPIDILAEESVDSNYGQEAVSEEYSFLDFMAGLYGIPEETQCGKCKRFGSSECTAIFDLPRLVLKESAAIPSDPVRVVLVSEGPETIEYQANKFLFTLLDQVFEGQTPEMLWIPAVRCGMEKAPTAKIQEMCASLYLKRLLLSKELIADDAIIVAIGSNAWKALHLIAEGQPKPSSVNDIHGLPSKLTFKGMDLMENPEVIRELDLVPVLHPAYILKNMRKMDDIVTDFQKIKNVLGVGWNALSIMDDQQALKDNALLYTKPLTCKEIEDVVDVIMELSGGEVVLDVESRNTNLASVGNYLTLTGFGASEEQAIQLADEALSSTKPIIRRIKECGGSIVGQNIYFDFMMLYKQRLIDGIDDLPEVHRDTMVMQQLIDENTPAGLKTMVQQYFGIPDWSNSLPSGTDYGKIPMEQLAPYHACDLCYNKKLYAHLQEIIDLEEVSGTWVIDYVDLMHKVDRILLGASISGMKLNTEYMAQLEEQYTQQMEELRSWFNQPIFQRVVASLEGMDKEMKEMIAGSLCDYPLAAEYNPEKHIFNPASTQQLGAYLAVALDAVTKTFLFKKIGRSLRTNKGAISLNEANLLAIKTNLSLTEQSQREHISIVEALDKVLEYREKNKIFGTYITGMTKHMWPDECVRAHWKVRGTVTGRLACSEPNLQQIPRDKSIKNMFIPKHAGWLFMQFDLSQAEMRGLASVTGDETLAAGYRKGLDMHKYVASKAFNIPYDQVSKDQRQAAKSIGFASIYGSNAYGLAAKNGLPVDKCQELLDNFFKEFPKVQPWIKSQHYMQQTKGYIVGVLGRKRHLPSHLAREDGGADLLREAQNAGIQNLASDFNLLILINMLEEQIPSVPGLSGAVNFVNTVHDSLIFEVDPTYATPLAEAYYNAVADINAFYQEVLGEQWVDMAGDMEIGPAWGTLIGCELAHDGEPYIEIPVKIPATETEAERTEGQTIYQYFAEYLGSTLVE